MTDGAGYGDIIIMALVAGFILLRLRSMLGKTTGDEESRAQQRRELARELEERIVKVAEKAKQPQVIDAEAAVVTDEKHADPSTLRILDQIRATDTSFTAESFLNGAKGAFEMVFTAFGSGDKTTLKNLLSDPLYQTFEAEIAQREKNETRVENTLLSIDSARITAAEKERNMARVTVHFISEQVSIERDAAGAIVSGDPSHADKVEDEWTFERELTSRNPNWKIIDT